ncbi:serine/threonine-protein kinase [Nocardia sp. CDC153]|uniref:serine/threonine-protein kinase n=1 Tax=Nocardia sp. CDC153 TaxID=3112167 RepID=UPI002DB941E9|nr:serine/threonine-protein kinase [Nocardia sp. CDC153]MEC3953182.1 serine/threonine-protein kinase [Nocardia sp. CDC153]
MQLGPGTVFAGHVIEREIGAGGMGAVYLARHPRLRRLVALKVLTSEKNRNSAVAARFEREIELITALEHPNIIPVYDRGVEDGMPWLSMKYVAGGDVASLIAREGALAPQRAVRLLADAAAGLDFAHRRGVVHRDVKPANLLLESVDGQERVLVADFGIARAVDATVTATGLLASFAYTAPERFEGEVADGYSDIYSLGCTFFQMLTGRVPFPGDSEGAVVAAHLTATPPRPSGIRPSVPGGLDAVIARALAKSPQDRYPDCASMVDAARAALAEATTSESERPGRTRTRRPASRRAAVIFVAVGIASVAAIAAPVYLHLRAVNSHSGVAATATDTASATSTDSRSSSTALPSPVATPPRVISRCGDQPEIRPTKISALHCGTNADIWIDDLVWSRWDQTAADGTGTIHRNTCQPSCSAGHYMTVPVSVTLQRYSPFFNVYMSITIDDGTALESDDLPTG